MGTNYYTIDIGNIESNDICPHCNGNISKLHIGKKSYGWEFSFQGYKFCNLTSWKEWKEFLKENIIFNEYNEKISFDTFVSLIEESGPGSKNDVTGLPNASHNKYMMEKYSIDPIFDWFDDDGYSFSSRDFS